MHHLEFAPPAQPGTGRAWVIAGLVHALLFMALGLATAWKTQPQTVQAEAELWSATPQAAAPRLQEPLPEPEPEPEPAPQPKPAKPTPPPPPAPDLAQERLDAQIALEKKKQQDKKKEADKAEKLKAEKEKTAKLKAEKEKAELKRKEREKEREKEDKAKEKAAKEKKAQEEKERDKKKAAEKASAEKADAARADALRKENLKRMQGMAGASGGENASGTALKSSGPSASYAGRLVGRIKPNITYPGDVVGNPRAEVEVKVSPDGTILSRRIVQTSGNKAWDDAVLRAIDKTEIFPKDSDGRVPPVIVLGFRPQD
ncbi:MAG: cell envelope integrity protein TolA [Limnohabitans sp.]|uniref:cell envelope integrity protein TolA n=1 Tax=Limnohabitans sp. TaxID=1907725 RepID=UPI001B6483E3|nr:cell envelope integrity protein TolA [Limnohabitans sp.]MBP6219807.1 cell envelope integrity protein TolA [Limnohabitans sp.]MBP6244172.1 cell envelope integrity protein TolA [Limnohabitans sp.]